jgi:hypothetical protein
MDDKEFEKYVELIASMSIDYMTKGELTKETYINNLKLILKNLEQ